MELYLYSDPRPGYGSYVYHISCIYFYGLSDPVILPIVSTNGKRQTQWSKRQAAAEALKKKVSAKSTSATNDKTKYTADWTKGEIGDDGVRTEMTHEQSAAEAYERCGLSWKTAIALVEEGCDQMSDL